MMGFKFCPYCGARDSLSYWIKSKENQTTLKGEKSPLDIKLSLPICSECKNVLRYYLDAYRNKVYIKNKEGL